MTDSFFLPLLKSKPLVKNSGRADDMEDRAEDISFKCSNSLIDDTSKLENVFSKRI